MIDEVMTCHHYIVEGLLFVVVVNLILLYSFGDNLGKVVYWTRIGYFSFWGLWSMVVFSGMMVFVFAQQALTYAVDIMIAVSILLALLEGYRSIKTRQIWVEESNAVKFSTTILILEIVLIAIVTIIAIRAH